MLGLVESTSAAWAPIALADLPQLMADHAHCELKAAHNALSLVGRYGAEHPSMVEPLMALAQQEITHFNEVQHALRLRGWAWEIPSSDAYAAELRESARKPSMHRDAFLDRLVVAALIEARSCERFKLIAQAIEESELKDFYFRLMQEEAQHFTLFTDLARDVFGERRMRARFAELAIEESRINRAGPCAPRVHG